MSYSDDYDLLIDGDKIIDNLYTAEGAVTAAPPNISVVRRSMLSHMYEKKASDLATTPDQVSLVTNLGYIDERPK